MKRLLVLPVLLGLLFCACKSHSKTNVLSPSNLISSFINIDAGKDNVLKTGKGAIIKIAANSFNVPAGTHVLIEVKEAYNMQDILKAGLITESYGQPLQSGGMIFIGATAEGKELGLLKPVKVSVPTTVYDSNMQIFKGELNADSTINWVDPGPLDSGVTSKQLLEGEAIFKANCASCHKPWQEATGPALAGCRLRGIGPDWAYRFTNNTNSMIETDPYAKYLLRRYGSKMTEFNLSYKDLKAVFDYCDNDYSLHYKYEPSPVANISPEEGFVNPCGTDTFYLPKPSENDTITLFSPGKDEKITAPEFQPADQTPAEARSNEGQRSGFTDPNSTDGMYDFSIATLGWYNIDHFVKGYPGTEYVSVNAMLEIPEDISDMHVYLFYPQKKMLSVGSVKERNVYHFDKIDGKIPLYLNSNVILLAFGSKGNRMYYGASEFAVKKEQSLTIKVKATTEEIFKQFIGQNNIEGIKINIEKKEKFRVYDRPCGDTNTDSAIRRA